MRRNSKAKDRTHFKATCTNILYCDNVAATALDKVSKCSNKTHVSARIEGSQCQMEVDSGPTFSLISDATARCIFPKGHVPNLQPLDVIMRNFQAHCIAVCRIGTVQMQFKNLAAHCACSLSRVSA